MKNVLHILVSLVFLINSSCKAQQLVQTTADVPKLKTNEQQFINKPLKKLLDEIKPEIKIAYGNIGDPSYFSFRFIDPEEIKRRPLGSSLGLYVYVKDRAFAFKLAILILCKHHYQRLSVVFYFLISNRFSRGQAS